MENNEANPPEGSLQKLRGFLFENTTARQTVAKNTFWLTLSNFGGRFIKAIIIIYAARVLGTAEYGVFSYAITLAGFMTLLMDPGVNGVLTRDAAKLSEEERRDLFSTTFVIKLVLLLFGLVVIIFVAPLFSTLPGAKILLPIVAFILMFDTLREFFMSLLRGLEKMEWEAATFLFTNFAIVIAGFAFIIFQPSARSLAFGYAVGTALGAASALFIVRDYIKDVFKRFTARLVRPIVTSAWPFAVAGALGMLLTNTDILIISWIRTASDVGIYSAAIRVIQIFYIIPGVLQISTLPLFSRLAGRDNPKFRIAFERVMSILFLIAIPLSLGGIALGAPVISFIFGPAFAPGSNAFKLLMATMVIDFPGTVIGAALFAYGHQKSLIVASAIGGISNVIFDILFIPRWGMTGSGFATLFAQTLSNGYLWFTMKKINYFEVLPSLKKVIAISIAMFFMSLILLALHVEVLINIVICVVFYFALLKFLKDPLLEEMAAILPFTSKKALS